MVPPVFDLRTVPVPFRMQPGLQRIDGGSHLTPLTPGSTLWREKQALLAAGGCELAVPGFDTTPVRSAIAARARAEGLGVVEPFELAVEQDFALLDGRDGTLPWLSVWAPSHWAPEEKLGLPFAAVHAPVADNQLLLVAARQLVQLVTSGGEWERSVWTLSPSGRYDQHPQRHARTAWSTATDPAVFAAHCWLRSERQTFFPLAPGAPQAIFTIHVTLQPLVEAVATPAHAQRLHACLDSMTDAVLAYKGLAPARDRLLAWLAAKSA